MSRDWYNLTTEPKALCMLIDQHLEREEVRLSARWLTWKLAYHYLQGARRFDVFDPTTGQISAHHLDEEGNMEFQSQELLSQIDRVSSQLASMDVRPMVSRAGSSLGAIKERSVAQIMADATVSRENVEKIHAQFANLVTTLGSCGITGHIEDHPTIGLTADYEIVHPRELFPFPSLGQDYTKQRGLVRRRTVPLGWLKDKFGRRISDNKEDLYWWEAQAGDIPTNEDDAGLSGGGTFGYSGGKGSGGGGWNLEDTSVGLCRVEEVWLFGHRDMVRRYIIKSGEYVIYDSKNDYRDLEVYCPIGMSRLMDNGTFHGAGLFDLLFSLHRQMELMLKSLFNNIRDADRYGIVVMPSGQFNQRSALKDVGRGLRVLSWEPDVVDSGFRPFNISPFNSGDIPGKTAAFAREMLSSLSPWQDLLREKGRVESATGLGFLDEKIKGLMSNATRSVDAAWSCAHRAVLAAVAREVSASKKPLQIHDLNLELAGAVIDLEKESISFDQNPLPRMSSMTVTIRETNPISPLVRKQEAVELYQLPGFGDPQRFILFALKEGLDFAMDMESEKSAYESIVRTILVLFGNGEEAGEVILTPETASPDLQLQILSTFMSSPVMQVASPEVKDEFSRLKEFLLMSSGMALPQAVQNPDDIAMMMQPEAAGMLPQGMSSEPQAMMG